MLIKAGMVSLERRVGMGPGLVPSSAGFSNIGVNP